MKRCPSCNMQYDDTWGVCLHCSKELVPETPDNADKPVSVPRLSGRAVAGPLVWALRLLVGVLLASFCGWLYCMFFLTSTPWTLPFAKRLIAMADTMHPGSVGEFMVPVCLVCISASLVFGILLTMRKLAGRSLMFVGLFFVMLVVVPYLIPALAVQFLARDESKIELIFLDKAPDGAPFNYARNNKGLYYTFPSWKLPKQVTSEIVDGNMEKAYAELKKQARKRGADGIILRNDAVGNKTEYLVAYKDSKGRKYNIREIHASSIENSKKWMDLRGLDYKVVRTGRYVTGTMVLFKNTDKAVPMLIEFLRSPSRRNREQAIVDLAAIGDARAIAPLMAIVANGPGRYEREYLYALDALAKMHHDPVYPVLLQMASDGYHLSWVVDLLKQFPDEEETIPALMRIAGSAKEKYIRKKAAQAIEYIQSLSVSERPIEQA